MTRGMRLRRTARSAFMVLMFAGMVYALDRLLRSYRYADVAAGFRGVRLGAVVIVVGLIVVEYTLLVGREWLAVGYAGRDDLGPRRTALAALIARPLSSLGVSTITGLGLRARIYGAWGFNSKDLALVTTYNELTYYVGIVVTCGVVFTVSEVPWPPSLAGRLPPMWTVGALGLAVAAAYVVWCARRTRPIEIRTVIIPLPDRTQLAGQVVLPVADLLIAAGIVHALLPASTGLTYLELIAVCLIANISGSISQVPAGLGVFEAIVLQFVPPAADRSAVLGALLVRRLLTNLLPMAMGALLLAWFELRRRPAARHGWHADTIATVLSVMTFASGVVLLVLGADPEIRAALSPSNTGPLGLFVVGVWLLVVARGLQQRTRRAWRVAFALIGVRAIAEIVVGPRPAIVALLGIEAAVFLAWRRVFTERGVVLHAAVASWWAAVLMAIIATSGIAYFAEGDTLTRLGALQLVAAAVIVSIASGFVGYQIAKQRREARQAARATPTT